MPPPPRSVLRPPAPPQRGPAPTMSFEEAIRQYQGRYPSASRETYEALFPYLQGLGFDVERPTRAGGTAFSDDKIVNRATGEVFDVIGNVDPATGSGPWAFAGAGYWVNGAPSATPPGGTTVGRRENLLGAPSEGTAVPRGSLSFGVPYPFPAAYEAMLRQRKTARAGGRASTILGGFTPGTPNTRRPTLLGRSY